MVLNTMVPSGMMLCLTVVLAMIAATSAWDGWSTGRATHYGQLGDPWSIHTGSCGYGYLDPEKCTGWDIAAMADKDADYQGSCGRCYEIQCRPASFKDNYGQNLDRGSACYDSSASVIVMITDTCPCNYPSNAYSNYRWCCGDMQHFDLSAWAFEKLGDLKQGVMGINYRQVSCDAKPEKPPAQITPSPGYPYPKGYAGDKRSCGSAYPITQEGSSTNLNQDGGQPGQSSGWSSASAAASSWSSGSSSNANSWSSASSGGSSNANSGSSTGNDGSSSNANSWSSTGNGGGSSTASANSFASGSNSNAWSSSSSDSSGSSSSASSWASAGK